MAIGAGLLLMTFGCSNIDEDERYVYVELAKAARNVLIEDFTGQLCVNCPKAANAIAKIQKDYDHSVIAVAIHSGGFGLDESKTGLMNATGQEYWNKWFSPTTGQPIAKIGRGEGTNDFENWSAEVAKQLEKETDVYIAADLNYDAEKNVYTVDVKTQGKAGRKANLQVWATESNITAIQALPLEWGGGYDMNYVHNHVFRAAVNGTWGEPIAFTEEKDEIQKTYTFTPASGWNKDNMAVVVFVYDDNEVLQVEEATPVVSE